MDNVYKKIIVCEIVSELQKSGIEQFLIDECTTHSKVKPKPDSINYGDIRFKEPWFDIIEHESYFELVCELVIWEWTPKYEQRRISGMRGWNNFIKYDEKIKGVMEKGSIIFKYDNKGKIEILDSTVEFDDPLFELSYT